MKTLADTALAYDRIAADYDTHVAGSQWMRAVLWDAYRRLFQPGQRVLDLSCGTGIDALFLAGLGVHVAGIDISPGMIQQPETKARRLGLSDMILTSVHDIAELSTWHADDDFDGIISAFAGLSTIPDLQSVATEAAHLLRPGGFCVVHMLNRFCLWTWLDLVRHMRWQEAHRARGRSTMLASIGGIPIEHYVYFPRETYRRFFLHPT
jgi:ubiquinone/menaquinone biosynthesis C-methylase UbiE